MTQLPIIIRRRRYERPLPRSPPTRHHQPSRHLLSLIVALFSPCLSRYTGFGFARPRHLPLIQQTVVAPLTRRHRLRLRPGAIATLNQRHFCADILCTNRHARNDTATPIVLPAPHSGFLTGTGHKILEAASQLDYGKTGYDER